MVFVPDLVEWMRNGGEAQYDPAPASNATSRSLDRRRADRPAWMDRVSPRPSA